MFTRSRGESLAGSDAMYLRKEILIMIYVGMDVASNKHDVCIMNENGEVYGKKFQIKNTKDEYKKLLNKISNAKKLFKDSIVRIGIESTGVYSSTILNYFSNIENIEVIFINPVLTSMFQLSESVHYAKTDSIDAEGICNYLIDKKNKLFTYTPISYQIQKIKSLYRELVKLNKLITQTTNRLNGLIHIVFPEFLKVFSKIKGKLTLNLLSEYPTPEAYKGKHFNTLYEFARKYSKGHISKENIEKLLEYSKNSIGIYCSSDALIIKQMAQLLLLLNNQKDEIIKELVKLTKEECPNLLTIPGIGALSAAGIIGEIGNISNFRNADSMLSFAGLDPIVYESGKFKAKSTPITKHGSSYLRNALILASRAIVRNDKTFKDYFTKKLNEGKSYNCSIGHVSKKLVRVIFSLLKNNKTFESVNN